MKNPAVDAYIAKSAAFARPILTRVRGLMHKACPKIEETIKWGVPHFEYQGVVASMAAFKQHASVGFWKQKLMPDPARLFPAAGDSSMGGRKFRSVDELPSDAVLLRYIKAAVALNEQGLKLPNAGRKKKPPPRLPADLAAALKKNPKAKATYDAFPPSHKREYVEWITEAKQEATRLKRLQTAIEWMAQGKSRHWKYQDC
ncbi:MAG TPA: YdeI/OmpD-associated family protein [Steroidobacteraceae bacterium]|nr:YdeI/OmpD-associated family protein [Steroidobacteraceae bacterium]